MLRIGTLILVVCATWTSPLASERQVLTFRTRAWLSFAPPTCRMAPGQYQGIPQADPEGRVTPRFCHRLISFRHFIGGLLALASLNRACRNRVPASPQRSPPLLLTTAACGGLRSAPDCRTRRALLHLSYSYAPPVLVAALVSHDERFRGRDASYLAPPAQIRTSPIRAYGLYGAFSVKRASRHFCRLCHSILLFDPRREHSFVPTAYFHRRRAQRRSRTARLQRRRRLVLDGREHGGRLAGWLAA